MKKQASIPYRQHKLERRIKRLIIIVFLSLVGWGLGLQNGVFEEVRPRTGILFQSTLGLGEAFSRAAQMVGGGIYLLNPLYILAAPIYLAEALVLSPCYDIICLPRDLYIRFCGGFSVSVFDADGTPLPNVHVSATIPRLGGWLQHFPDERMTRENGTTWFPFRGDFLNVEAKESTIRDSSRFLTCSILSGDRALRGIRQKTFIALKQGVSYAPCRHKADLPLSSNKNGSLVSIDLATGDAYEYGIGSQRTREFGSLFNPMNFRWEVRLMTLGIYGGGVLRINRDSELPVNFKQKFEGLAFKDSFLQETVPKKEDVHEDAENRKKWIARRLAYRKDHPNDTEPLKWTWGRFKNRERKGIGESEWLLVKTRHQYDMKIGDRYGVFTSCFVEYGDDLDGPVLHLEWFFNLEPNKDWFDLKGTPVVVPPSSSEMSFVEASATDSEIPCLRPTSICGKSGRIDGATVAGSGKKTTWLNTDN